MTIINETTVVVYDSSELKKVLVLLMQLPHKLH